MGVPLQRRRGDDVSTGLHTLLQVAMSELGMHPLNFRDDVGQRKGFVGRADIARPNHSKIFGCQTSELW